MKTMSGKNQDIDQTSPQNKDTKLKNIKSKDKVPYSQYRPQLILQLIINLKIMAISVVQMNCMKTFNNKLWSIESNKNTKVVTQLARCKESNRQVDLLKRNILRQTLKPLLEKVGLRKLTQFIILWLGLTSNALCIVHQIDYIL